jgi:hypothetical protein
LNNGDSTIAIYSNKSALYRPTALLVLLVAFSSAAIVYYGSSKPNSLMYYSGWLVLISGLFLLLSMLVRVITEKGPLIEVSADGLRFQRFAKNMLTWDTITNIDEWQFSLLSNAAVPVRLIRITYNPKLESTFSIWSFGKFFRTCWHEKQAFSIATSALSVTHEDLLKLIQSKWALFFQHKSGLVSSEIRYP